MFTINNPKVAFDSTSLQLLLSKNKTVSSVNANILPIYFKLRYLNDMRTQINFIVQIFYQKKKIISIVLIRTKSIINIFR